MGKRNKLFFDYKKNQTWAENLTLVMQIGLTMAGCICLCFFIGLTLDKWLGTHGVLVTVFTILGVGGGGNVVYRQIMEIIDTAPPEGNDNGDG